MNCSGISKSVSVMVIYFLFNIQTLKFFFQKTSSIFLFSLHSLTLCSIKVHVLGEKPKSFSNLLSFFYSTYRSLILLIQGADLGGGGGGGGGRPPFSQGFDTLPTQRVPPLVLFKKSTFGRPNLKFF